MNITAQDIKDYLVKITGGTIEDAKKAMLDKLVGSRNIVSTKTNQGWNVVESSGGGLVLGENKALDYSPPPPVQAPTPAPEPIKAAPAGMEGWMLEQSTAPIKSDVKQYLDNRLLPLTRAKGIPDALAAAQWAVEGGRQQKNNPFGLMFGGQVHPYQSLENAVSDYDLTLRNILSRHLGIPEEQFKYSDYTPEELVRLLQENVGGGIPSEGRYEGHSQNPRQYSQLLMSVPEWRHYIGGGG